MALVSPLRLVGVCVAAGGIVGNVLVVCVFLKTLKLRKPINLFLLALAFSDITHLALKTPGPYMKEALINSHNVCVATAFVLTAQGVFSVNCFAATAVLRYISVLHPMRAKRLIGWKPCLALAAASFLECLLLSWPICTQWITVQYLETVGICMGYGTEMAYSIMLTIIGIFLPSLVTIFCYVRVLLKRYQSRKRVQAVTQTDGQPSFKNKDMRLFLQVVVLLGVFFATWAPRTITANVVGIDNMEYQTLFEVFAVISVLDSSVNIFVYIIFNREFRTELRKIFRCFYQKRDDAGASNLDSTNAAGGSG